MGYKIFITSTGTCVGRYRCKPHSVHIELNITNAYVYTNTKTWNHCRL